MQPLQLSASTTATAGRAGCGRKGSAKSSAAPAPTTAQTKAGEVASTSGCTKSRIQSSRSASGTRASVAGAWLTTGLASASAASVANSPSASGRGGSTAARVMRWTWNHSPNSISSGAPMCTNTKSENRRSLTAPSTRKLRASGAASNGSASSHSAVAMAEY